MLSRFLSLFLLLFTAGASTAPKPGPAQANNPTAIQNYALLFAVNDYRHPKLSDLSNPISNTREIALELQERYGFKAVVVENPTLDEVEQKLESYQKQFAAGNFDPKGQLFLFFSGHGLRQYNNGYWMPADGDPAKPHRTGLAYEIWRPRFDAINCQHILVAIDACYSVTFDPNWQNRPGRHFERPGELNEQQKVLENHKKYRARLFFTSDGTEDQTPDRSNFAKKLLEGLRTHPGSSGWLTSSELYALYLEKAFPVPGSGAFGSDEAGASFLFFRKENTDVTATLRQDLDAWKEAEKLNTLYAYRNYLTRFPNGEFRAQAEAKARELEREDALVSDLTAWQRAKGLDSREGYEAYLKDFPDGEFRSLAEAALKTLTLKATKVAPAFSSDLPVARDPAGRTYKTIKLNGQLWLAENLDYDVGEGCWCYEDKEENCAEYGRLYDWEAAKKACRALGEGWRLPEHGEWKELAMTHGGLNDSYGVRGNPDRAYLALIKDGSSGFDALLGGGRNSDGSFEGLEELSNYWSSEGTTPSSAYLFLFESFQTFPSQQKTGSLSRHDDGKSLGASCRCIQDAPPDGKN